MMTTANAIQPGNVLVFRPDPDTLTFEHQPTIYRKVEKVEHWTSRGGNKWVSLLVRAPHSDGHWLLLGADDKCEITTDYDRSCSVNPDGLVLA